MTVVFLSGGPRDRELYETQSEGQARIDFRGRNGTYRYVITDLVTDDGIRVFAHAKEENDPLVHRLT